MQLLKTIDEVREFVAGYKKFDREVGFVPTMGYLHDGHMSLVDRAVQENECTVVSIFVNPTQFLPGEDFEEYPRDEAADLQQCEDAGVDAVFLPSVEVMYGSNALTSVHVSQLSDTLCGMSRGVGHFVGVCTVVCKLFNIVQPDRVYFGQKDAQQALVIAKMIGDLNIPVDIKVCPIKREDDGLAMSSRNARLSEEERSKAITLYTALCEARNMIHNGEKASMVIREAMTEIVENVDGVEVDYLEIVDPVSLGEAEWIDDTVLIAGAVKLGGVRLIDNLLVHPENGPWEDDF
jgi:pantoate--beta-alanine ligase